MLKRILYLTSVDVSSATGPGVNEREFLVALGKRADLQVAAVVPRPSTAPADFGSVEIFATRKFAWASAAAAILNQYDLIRTARRLMKVREFDVIVCRVTPFPWGLAALVGSARVPVFVKTLGHGATEGLRGRKGMQGLMLRPLLGLHSALVRRVVRRSSGIDACTPELIAFLAKSYQIDKNKFALVPNATNTDRFLPVRDARRSARSAVADFDPLLGYVGGQPFTRGGRQIIEAVARLKESMPRIGAFIAGGHVEALQRHAVEAGVADRCVVPGKIPYEQVAEIVPLFDVGFALDAPDRLTIVGNSNQKLRQYLAAGVPVITTSHAGQFVEQAGVGVIVSPEDIEAIVAACVRLCGATAEDREAVSARAREFAVRELSVDRMLEMRLEFWADRSRTFRAAKVNA